MKKLWFVLLMMCTIGALTACSDDDNNDNGGKSPVSNVYLPSAGQIGQEIEVLGDGFASTAEFYLKDAAGEQTKVTEVTFSAGKVLLTVPESLAVGKYSLILKQNGDWTLGSLDIVKGKLKVTRLASIGVLIDFGYEDEVPEEVVYRMTYDDQNRLSAFSYSTVIEEGQTQVTSCSFEYSGKTITASGNAFDGDYYKPFSFELGDNSRVVSSKIDGVSTPWTYTSDGYLEKTTLAGIDYLYDFKDGNLLSVETADCYFEYGSDKNSAVVDVVSCILASGFGYENSVVDPQFCAYLLGIAGKTSTNLPSSLTFSDLPSEIHYTWYEEDGNVKTVKIPWVMDEDFKMDTTITFKYETVEIDQ